MKPSEVYDVINASTASTGGTTEGMSRDIKATACGMLAAFSEALPGHTFNVPQQFFDAEGKVRVIGNRAGSAFHALQEARFDHADLPEPKAFEDTDAAVAAAVMAYKRYMKQQGGDFDFVGRRTAREFPIAGLIAGQKRTGRLDDVLEASEAHVDRWAELGIFAASPGLYAWDYKLLKAVTMKAAEEYADSMQALAYMKLYEQTTGLRLGGFIHDLVSRAAGPKITRMLVLTPNIPQGEEIVSEFVTLATVRRAEGKADASKCHTTYGKCPFKGLCPRRGDRHTNADLIANEALLRSVAAEMDDE